MIFLKYLSALLYAAYTCVTEFPFFVLDSANISWQRNEWLWQIKPADMTKAMEEVGRQ